MKTLVTKVFKELTSLTETIPSGFKGLYARATGLWYKNSDGTEKQLAIVDNVPSRGTLITVAQLDDITLGVGFYNLENVTINGNSGVYAYAIQLGNFSTGGYKAQILIPYTGGYQTHGMLLRVASATAYPSTWSRVCNDSLTVNGFNVNQNLRTTDSPTFVSPIVESLRHSAGNIFTKRNTVYNNAAGNVSLEEMALFHTSLTNRIRFAPPALQEHVTNANYGTMTWTNPSTRATTQQLKDLVNGEGNVTTFNAIPIANVGEKGVYRLTWDVGNAPYVTLSSLFISCSTSNNVVTLLVETYNNVAGVWTSAGSGNIQNWPGTANFPHSRIFFDTVDTVTAWKCQKVRLTFTLASATVASGFQLYGIEWFGDYPVGGRNLFTVDSSKNVVWPASVESSQIINFNAAINPTQNGNPITKTSTWMWQYLVQGINWLKNNFNGYSLINHTHAYTLDEILANGNASSHSAQVYDLITNTLSLYDGVVDTNTVFVSDGLRLSVDNPYALTGHIFFIGQNSWVLYHDGLSICGAISMNNITANRAWEHPDKDGTYAMLDDINAPAHAEAYKDFTSTSIGLSSTPLTPKWDGSVDCTSNMSASLNGTTGFVANIAGKFLINYSLTFIEKSASGDIMAYIKVTGSTGDIIGGRSLTSVVNGDKCYNTLSGTLICNVEAGYEITVWLEGLTTFSVSLAAGSFTATKIEN